MDSQHSTHNSQLGTHARRAPLRGFALLITITLLAFLVILLVGLGIYVRVETSIAGNTQRQMQARQNALVGLNVAVSQLQKFAGPDTRVTATGEVPGGARAQNFTGVWDTNAAAGSPAMTWLVSRSEQAGADPDQILSSALNPATEPTANQALLVGNNTVAAIPARPTAAELARRIKVNTLPITSPGVPGVNGNAQIGRYGWWVGDQGVKAPVAVSDASANVTYAPWDTADARLRLRQQISLGAGAADANGAPVFEPRDAASSPLVSNDKVVATNQLAFLRTASSTGAAVATTAASIGLAPVQQNFHAWSPNNYAVLASTAPSSAGLRRDLSLDPTLLGPAYVTWADYTSYMEPPVPAAPSASATTTTPTIPPTPSPDYSSTNPVRRRYVMQAPPQSLPGEVARTVAPVLNYFLLSFSIRTVNGATGAGNQMEARARWMFSLWNPYTAALVPEDLRLEVTGLPTIQFENDTPVTSIPPVPRPPIRSISLQSLFGSSALTDTPLNIRLPWDSITSTAADRQSWLPGRTYAWTALEDKLAVPSDTGFASKFYSRNLSADAGQGVIIPLPVNPIGIDGSDTVKLHGHATTLKAKLYVVRASGDVLLATFRSPDFFDFDTASRRVSDGSYQFSYVFRLAESIDGVAWLTTPNKDLRASALTSDQFIAGPNGPRPEQYDNYVTISDPNRLLDRATNGLSYNEDTPVFEFPRAPLLSLGALQHLPIEGRRPFAIGNSWGSNEQLNGVRAFELFDRFFYSGLVPGVVPTPVNGITFLPNPLQKLIPRKSSAGGVTDVVTDVMTAPNAQSSKFLMQGGAFNVNSTSVAAWTAVLRSVRFPAPLSFRYMDSSYATGTTSDTNTATSPIVSSDAQFFRFSQTAQEVFKAEAGYAASTVNPANTAPDVPSSANTHLFRKGMKTLSAGVVRAMADRIVQYVKVKHAASGAEGGPFRTMEEFLSPSALFQDANGNNRTLLEAAIADAATSGGESANGLVPEFSSQWLTQADVLTALAPVLFTRSDTFVVRAYGESINPASGLAEGKAWCEAIVQRTPEYFDPTDPAETAPASLTVPLNQANGRRFKVVSFRWLTRSDI